MKLHSDFMVVFLSFFIFVFNSVGTMDGLGLMKKVPLEQKDIQLIKNTSSSGGGGGSYIMPPRVDLAPRDNMPIFHIKKGITYVFPAAHLVGREREDYAPVYIKNAYIDDVSLVDFRYNDREIILKYKAEGQTTVTADVYHRYYGDIWTTVVFPITVSDSVYNP